ncbi:hypothetical protein [Cohnella terricola]|nr:hypothetical protein [Cohnella terricola]
MNEEAKGILIRILQELVSKVEKLGDGHEETWLRNEITDLEQMLDE